MQGQTPKKAGYIPRPDARPARNWRGLMVFEEKATGKLELYARRTSCASWCIRYRGAVWEFCSTVTA